jgi:hypothetical protein
MPTRSSQLPLPHVRPPRRSHGQGSAGRLSFPIVHSIERGYVRDASEPLTVAQQNEEYEPAEESEGAGARGFSAGEQSKTSFGTPIAPDAVERDTAVPPKQVSFNS